MAIPACGEFLILTILQLAAIALLFTSLLGSIGSTIDAPDSPNGRVDSSKMTDSTAADHGRLVIFLVDALRADMVSDRHEMIRTRRMLSQKRAKGYVARAHAPTVTMPRIKALMNGNVPQFLDLVRNLAATGTQNEDSLIGRLRSAGKRLVVHGDDTWLKLYPGAFAARSDGTTSSFFTPDFVEVDWNVTRHIKEDLDPAGSHAHSNDWDVLILHYLGLDHVGHQLGPDSKRMQEKLEEMDETLWDVLQKVHSQDVSTGSHTLVLLLSDHGMNGAGNHGGSSPQETSAVAVFFQSPFDQGLDKKQHKIGENLIVTLEEALQVDVAPSLSLALGLDLPSRSIGCPLEGAFRSTTSFDVASAVTLEHVNRLVSRGDSPNRNTSKTSSCHEAQKELLARSLSKSQGISSFDLINQTLALLLLVLVLVAQARLVFRFSWVDLGALGAQLVGFASSSAIENEHATIFFSLTTCLILISVRERPKNLQEQRPGAVALLVALGCARLLRTRLEIINFARLGGLSPQRVFLNEGTPLLPLPFLLGGDSFTPRLALPCLGILSITSSKGNRLERGLLVAGVMLCMTFSHVAAQPMLAHISAMSLVLSLCFSFRNRIQNMVPSLLGLACLFVRPTLLPMVLVGYCLLHSIHLLQDKETTTLSWLGGWGMFYAMGNSHSVATIDIAGGYVGMTEFSRERVALVTTLVVYFGPLLGSAVALEGSAKTQRESVARTLFFFQSARLLMMSLIAVIMQNHLFIWSVFAPRWGYEILWTLVLDVLVLLSFGLQRSQND